MTHLLNAFTELLAYIGDDYAADGHPNVVPRVPKLTKQQIIALVPKIEAAIDGNQDLLNNVEPDISQKILNILNLLDRWGF